MATTGRAPAREASPLLRVKEVSKRFGATMALDRVSLDLRAGEVHALVGENGAGKSTLVRILAGMLHPDSGGVFIDGVRQVDSPAATQTPQLAFIHQDFDLAPNLTVAENLLLNREPARFGGLLDRKRARREAQACLAAAGIDIDIERLAGELSVAERQMVAVARCLRQAARLLVMDEPTSALPPDDIEALLGLITRVTTSGTAVLFISHKLDEVFRIGQRVTVLRDGRVVGTQETTQTSVDEVVAMMVGRKLGALAGRATRPRGAPLLELRGLHSPGRFEKVDLSLARGEVLGLYGLKGAGRMAVARALFGLDPDRGGELRLDGAPVRVDSPRAAIRMGLAYVSRDRKTQGLFPNLGVGENLSIAALPSLARCGFVRRRQEQDAVTALLERLQVRMAGLNDPVTELSGGNQQKVMLARWLLTGPRVMILDEPTAGIDIGARFEIYELIDALAAEGLGVLLLSSDLPELLGLSDRVLVMHEGRILADLARAEASEEAVMRAIHGGALAAAQVTPPARA